MSTFEWRLMQCWGVQARQVFKLLADNAPNIRHAAATLAADMLEDEGQLFLGTQVTWVSLDCMTLCACRH